MNGNNGEIALVTGGHGFLGSHLVDLLLEQGVSVRCLLRPGRREEVFAGRPVAVARGDLRSEEGLEDAVAGVSVVYHVAGLTAARGPSGFFAVNSEGTRRLARAVRRANPGLRRIVYVSSQAAAGPSSDGRPVEEEDVPRPISHYGRSKLSGERVLEKELQDIPFSVVRPPAIYGPRDEAILPFFQMAARGLAPGMEGAGRRFNLLHARDVAAGLAAAGGPRVRGNRTYFLSDGTGYGYDEIAGALGEAFGIRPRRIPVPDLLLELAGVLTDEVTALLGVPTIFGRQKVRELKERYWLCSARRAKRELGWRPRIPLREGMAETAAWYVAEGRLPARGRLAPGPRSPR